MQSGQTIAGKYRLNQLLGTGGMASVWSATNIFTDRQIAMKFMLPSVARTPEAAKRFLMEAKVSARVDHPNIIEVIDVGQTEEGTLFPRHRAAHRRVARCGHAAAVAAHEPARIFGRHGAGGARALGRAPQRRGAFAI